MNIRAGGLRESLKEIFGELGLKIADELCGDFGIADAIGSATEIDRGDCEGFVHGHQEIAGAKNATFVAERL